MDQLPFRRRVPEYGGRSAKPGLFIIPICILRKTIAATCPGIVTHITDISSFFCQLAGGSCKRVLRKGSVSDRGRGKSVSAKIGRYPGVSDPQEIVPLGGLVRGRVVATAFDQ